MKLEDIDLTDEDTWADHVPHDQFSFLRAEAPVYRHPGNTIGDRVIEDFWALTRHADVQVVNRDTTTFSSEQRGVMVTEPDEETSAHFRTMLDTDPPAHTRLRRLVSRGFTPRMVTRFEEHYAQLTADLLAKAVAQGTFDFVTDIAAELPLMAIAEILGVPVEDRHKLFEWSNKLVGNSDPEYVGSADDALTAATELYVYFNLLGEERRAEPGDDIISRLITEVDGDALGPHEFETFCLLLTVAGNETTRNATSHGMHALLEHPDQMQLLRDNPELLDPAIEEILRWATPVIHFRRTATCATEVGWAGHRRGRRAGDVLPVGQPGRGGVRGPVHLRHHPRPQRPHRLRWRRGPPLPRRQPGPPRAADHLQGAAGVDPLDHPGRRRGPAPVQLHQRHQAHARRGRARLSQAALSRGRGRRRRPGPGRSCSCWRR